MATLNLAQINKLDIVDYLTSLGIHPEKISGHYYYYLSPFAGRTEDIASFRVDRHTNRWWDFRMGRGTTLLDFGLRYYDCTVSEIRNKFTAQLISQPKAAANNPAPEIEIDDTIRVIRTIPIQSLYLIRYLWERRIPLDVAQNHLQEAEYQFAESNRSYYALSFRCDAGGYQLRSKSHHYSVPPQSPTLIRNASSDIAVVVDHFNMLTLMTALIQEVKDLPNFQILNSSLYLETSLPLLDEYRHKYLYLDNTVIDDRLTQMALSRHPSYQDRRKLYNGYPNLNEWACHIGCPHNPPPGYTRPPSP